MIDELKVAPLNATQQASSGKRFAKYVAFLLLAFAVLNALAIFALPQDKFLRYQAPLDPQSPTAPWIYQRIHFDPTPIDIAFIGTSRTGVSVHTRRLEAGLAQHGIHVKAANIYIVRSGLNMQYVLAKELLNSRKVKLLVLEITEREERKPHDDFIYLADPIDVIAAPMIINFNYLSDLARLPGRQVQLFWDSEMQQLGLRDPQLAPQPYQGSNLDHAEVIRTIDGVNHYHNIRRSLAEMETMRLQQEREITPPVLPRFADNIEFRLPRYYENKILDLAKTRGTRVVFLYTPRYGGPENPPPYQHYASRAGLINPWPVVHNYDLWWDDNHLNWEGAKLLTDYVVEALAAQKSLITAPST